MLADSDFEPRDGQDKKDAAYAVCVAQLNKAGTIPEDGDSPEPKLSKDHEDVSYEEQSSNEDEVCSECRYFLQGDTSFGSCTLVQGEIAEAGTCDLWDEVQEQPPEDSLEAVWSTAFINDLPDSAFAIISPGGKKDDGGKTTPRSLRHLPHHGPEGSIDLPHLRNALQRLKQTGISDAEKSKAKSHLRSHMSKETTNGLVRENYVFEAEPKDLTGKEWNIKIISSGESKNKRTYSQDVLHRDGKVFEGVPVHAAIGEDHSASERGVRSIVGIIKDVRNVADGLEGVFHVSSTAMQELLLDLHKEGVLQDIMGFSIVADLDVTPTGNGSVVVDKIKEGVSVDIVRNAAAGGAFLSAKEAKEMPEDVKVVEISEEKLQELVANAAEKAANTAVAGISEKFLTKEEEAKHKYKRDKDGNLVKDEPEEPEEPKKNMGEAVSKAERELHKATESVDMATKRMNSITLTHMIGESKLPETAGRRVSLMFEDAVDLDMDTVREAIQSEQDYIASHVKVVVDNLKNEGHLISKVTVDEGDKAIARIDGWFADKGYVEIGDDKQKIRPFKSFTEAYAMWYGLNPFEVEKADVVNAFFGRSNKMNGFDSSDTRASEALYSEASLQQSDLAQVTADRMHKRLIGAYTLEFPQYDDWRKVSSVISVADYQAHRQIKFGGYGDLAVVVEKGTYPELSHPSDEESTVTMQKRGGIAAQITRELIINDNVGAIARIPKELALAAKRTLYKVVFDIFSTNDTYGVDSTALFTSGHANTGTTALSISGVDVAQVAMRSQTRALATDNVLGDLNMPRIIAVPNELQGLARRIVDPSPSYHSYSTADTDAQDDPERFKGQLDVIVVDYWTDATEYFLVANPSLSEGIGVAFLNGNEEPELFIQQDEKVGESFTMDVQNIKIRHEFREVIMDFRPFYRQT